MVVLSGLVCDKANLTDGPTGNCLPSCVSLSGDSPPPAGLVCALPPFIFVNDAKALCLPQKTMSGGVRLAGRSCLCLVRDILNFSFVASKWTFSEKFSHEPQNLLPRKTPPRNHVVITTTTTSTTLHHHHHDLLLYYLSPLRCVSNNEWWCPPLRSCLCLLSPFI